MKFIKILVLLGFLASVVASCGGQISPYDERGTSTVEASSGSVS